MVMVITLPVVITSYAFRQNALIIKKTKTGSRSNNGLLLSLFGVGWCYHGM